MEKTIHKGNGNGGPILALNEALKVAKETIGPSLKNAITDSAEQLSTLAEEAKKQLVVKTKRATKFANRSVHSQPWAYIAGAGIAGLALGYLLVRRK